MFRLLLITITFFHLSILTAYSQNISGEVIDGDTKESLPFVNVSCKQADATIAIVSTDFDGKFTLEVKEKGDYELQFHYTGYKLNSRIITVNDDLDISLGQILLKSTITELEGVTVTAEKESVNMTADGMSFNVEEGGGANMEDIVSGMPSITMDENGEVTSNGEQVVILVNGEESSLENPLEDIPMQLIERVELLNNPPAEYTSATTAINIVLKENVKLGNNARIYVEGGMPTQAKAGFNISRSGDKWSTTVNVRYIQNELPYKNSSERLNYGSNTRENESEYTQGLKMFNANWSSSYALSVNDKLRFNLSYSHRENTTESEEEELVQNIDPDNINPRINYRTASNNRLTKRLQAQLNYDKHFMTEGRKFLTTIRFSIDDYDQLNTNQTNTLYLDTDELRYNDERLTERDRPSKNLFANVKYVHPFNPSSILTTGFRNQTKIQTNTERFYNRDEDGEETNRGLGYQNTDYLNQKFTAYFQYKYKFVNDLTLNVGGIAENSVINSDIENLEDTFSTQNNFWVFNPNASLNKKFNENWMGRIAYSFRMNTPPEWMLNPTINDSNPLFISSGNPNLTLQKKQKLVLDVTNHQDNFSTRGGVFFRSTIDGVERVFENKGDTIYSTFANIVDKYTVGTNIYVQYQLSKKHRIILSGDLYHDMYNTRTGDFPLSQTMFNGKMTYKANLLNGFRVRLTGYYLSQTIRYNGTMTPASGVDASVSKSIYEGKGRLWLTAVDIFSTRKIYRSNISRTFESSNVVDLPTTVKLGFSWSFFSV
ncbi:outer membrane beta-barrel family protein [Flammeovirga sp. EKP202]|uniref:outer membrane beta-barrel family protein n=1 Tax=Flammeovirga sp. EKP202 TaxID=2770592 RepID=UPI00165FDD1A|nr:outer membrane beta-barrel family protein [Flammeovirga sp. EKP202]MBD0402071.1 TonB-dependent receptor [Flammeovirga sp. EKP202]